MNTLTSRDANSRGADAAAAGLFIAAPLSHGSNPNSNMAGRRREDDVNLVAGPLGGGNDGIGRRSEDDPNLVSFDWQAGGGGNDESFRGKSRSYIVRKGEYAQLGATKVDAIASPTTGVRRLTPRECERLQALPDDWTAHGPDSRRYAALGDAVTSSVAEWIGQRLLAHIAAVPAPLTAGEEAVWRGSDDRGLVSPVSESSAPAVSGDRNEDT